MKQTYKLYIYKLLLAFIWLFTIIQIITASVKKVHLRVKAPFTMPAIQTPDFSKCPRLNIVDFGAIQGNKIKTSTALAAAITEANRLGGGVVVVPAGNWLTSTLHFKSDVNLFLSKGATLLFSDDPNDYLPAVHTSWEGFECYNYSPLIYAYQCENIAITGEGEIKAMMGNWKKWFARPSGHMNNLKRLYYMVYDNVPVTDRLMVNDSANFRPQFIQINRCKSVLLENFSITNSPFWTVHLYLSKDIVMRKLHIFAHGHNNDGLDPEMSQNVLVEDCVFDQGDDAVAIKSGRAPEGWRSQIPSKNIVIRNCTVKNGHQLLAIGSELSGGIENVYVNNCQASPTANMFHLVYIKTNERMGGYVRNIFVSDVSGSKMEKGVIGIETDVLYQWKNLVPTTEKRLTPISDIYLKNIKASHVAYLYKISGDKDLYIKNVNIKNVVSDTIAGEKKTITENICKLKVQ